MNDKDSVRVTDVFSLYSHNILRRSTTVLVNDLSTAVVVSTYELQETTDEKVAAAAALQLHTVRENEVRR